MKKKTIDIFVCMLVIAVAALPVAGVVKENVADYPLGQTVQSDVAATSISSPRTGPLQTYSVIGCIANFGPDEATTFMVHMEIFQWMGTGWGTAEYHDTVPVISLLAGQYMQVSFEDWTPEALHECDDCCPKYKAVLTTVCIDDTNAGNDVYPKTFCLGDCIEISITHGLYHTPTSPTGTTTVDVDLLVTNNCNHDVGGLTHPISIFCNVFGPPSISGVLHIWLPHMGPGDTTPITVGVNVYSGTDIFSPIVIFSRSWDGCTNLLLQNGLLVHGPVTTWVLV